MGTDRVGWDAPVRDVRDLVDEEHDVLLQALSRECEVANVAEAEDGLHLASGHHGVQFAALAQVVGDDLGAGRAEADLQKSCHLRDGVLEHVRFALPGGSAPLLLELLQVQQRVFGKLLHGVLHLLDRSDHDVVRVARKRHGQHRQQHRHHARHDEALRANVSRVARGDERQVGVGTRLALD